jgi:hypothetical protein
MTGLELLVAVENQVTKRFIQVIAESIHRGKKCVIHGNRTARSLLLFCLVVVGISGCASPESIDMGSYDPAHNQKAIAGYYRNQAIMMREKAEAQATAAARYEALFGPEADLVSGAKSLAHYYEQTAQEFERVAEAHASVARSGKRPTAVP